MHTPHTVTQTMCDKQLSIGQMMIALLIITQVQTFFLCGHVEQTSTHCHTNTRRHVVLFLSYSTRRGRTPANSFGESKDRWQHRERGRCTETESCGKILDGRFPNERRISPRAIPIQML